MQGVQTVLFLCLSFASFLLASWGRGGRGAPLIYRPARYNFAKQVWGTQIRGSQIVPHGTILRLPSQLSCSSCCRILPLRGCPLFHFSVLKALPRSRGSGLTPTDTACSFHWLHWLHWLHWHCVRSRLLCHCMVSSCCLQKRRPDVRWCCNSTPTAAVDRHS